MLKIYFKGKHIINIFNEENINLVLIDDKNIEVKK